MNHRQNQHAGSKTVKSSPGFSRFHTQEPVNAPGIHVTNQASEHTSYGHGNVYADPFSDQEI